MDRAPVSFRVTLLPETTVTAPPKLLALFRVMSLAAPAVSEVVVPTEKAPLSVMAPAVVRVRLPLMLPAPRSRALMSPRATLAPVRLTAPPKSLFASVRVILLGPPAVRLEAPATVRVLRATG